jgi:hypothetical protein
VPYLLNKSTLNGGIEAIAFQRSASQQGLMALLRYDSSISRKGFFNTEVTYIYAA